MLRRIVVEPPSDLIELPDVDDLARIEADGGLVEDQHLRAVDHRLRDADPLAVALRELADQLAGDLGQAAGAHDLVDAGCARRAPGCP